MHINTINLTKVKMQKQCVKSFHRNLEDTEQPGSDNQMHINSPQRKVTAKSEGVILWEIKKEEEEKKEVN